MNIRMVFVCMFTLLFSQMNAQTRIMPLGNSITQGEEGYNSYRRSLYHLLVDTSSYDVDFVGSQSSNFCGEYPNPDFDMDHEGHWGWRIDHVAYGSSQGCAGEGSIGAWTNHHMPDIILAHLGTNDCWQSNSVSSSIEEMEALIDSIRFYNEDATILLAQTIPTTIDYVNVCLNEWNDSIPKIVERKSTIQSPIILVDQFSDFDANTDTYDGVHPNILGEEKIARKWHAALQPILDVSSSVLDSKKVPRSSTKAIVLEHGVLVLQNQKYGDEVSIYTLLGNLVLSTKTTSNDIHLDVNHLPSGIYVVIAGVEVFMVVR